MCGVIGFIIVVITVACVIGFIVDMSNGDI
jgi:hypothetical protein